MTPQNINEIYAVIEVRNGKEVGIMRTEGDFLISPFATHNEHIKENLKNKAILKIQRSKLVEGGKELDLTGLLVKFTNREVISVFGGEI